MTLGHKHYEQYAISVQDREMFASIEADFSVIVPKGEPPDGKPFRKRPTADTRAQPGPWQGLPEVSSWSVKPSRPDA